MPTPTTMRSGRSRRLSLLLGVACCLLAIAARAAAAARPTPSPSPAPPPPQAAGPVSTRNVAASAETNKATITGSNLPSRPTPIAVARSRNPTTGAAGLDGATTSAFNRGGISGPAIAIAEGTFSGRPFYGYADNEGGPGTFYRGRDDGAWGWAGGKFATG